MQPEDVQFLSPKGVFRTLPNIKDGVFSQVAPP